MTQATTVGQPGGPRTLPLYVVCDASTSMRGEPIDVVNRELREVHRVIANDPILSDICRMGVVAFSSEVQIIIPLSKLSHVEVFPPILAGGQTKLGRLFREIEAIIKSDVDRLKSEGRNVVRPVLFFITDGRPTDSWKTSLATLLDRSRNDYAPNMIAFGVGNAKEEIIQRIGVQRAMMAKKTESVPSALRAVMKSLTQSIIASARATDLTLKLPEPTDELRVIDRPR